MTTPSRMPLPLLTALLVAVLGLGWLVAPTPSAEASADRDCRRATAPLPDGLRPEGITAGPGSTYYVGSLADGRIVTGDLCRGTSSVLLPGAEGRQLRGLFHDSRSGLVWAVGNVGTQGHVWAVSARTGAVVADVVVPGAGFLNDLVVTDSYVDRLTRIDLDGRGQPADADPRFVSLGGAWPAGDGATINANGIRELPDRDLVLNNSRVGGLWQVAPGSGLVTEIAVTGGPGLTGGDGLERQGRTLYDVRGGGEAEVSVLRLERSPGRDAGWSARWVGALTDETLDVPSTATLAAGSLWAVNARFGVASPETASYSITRLPLR